MRHRVYLNNAVTVPCHHIIQLYVALSRCKSLDKMYICSELKDRIEIEKDIPLADSDVIDFYNK